MPVGVEALSLFEDQGISLAPSTTAPDDEVPAAAHGLGLPRGVPALCRGSGGLVATVVRLPHGPSGMAGGGRRASATSWRLTEEAFWWSLGGGHSVAKLSGRLFLLYFGPSRPIGTRSSSRVVSLPLMLSSTTQGGLRLFGTEVI